jgi:hypothetical protein
MILYFFEWVCSIGHIDGISFDWLPLINNASKSS